MVKLPHIFSFIGLLILSISSALAENYKSPKFIIPVQCEFPNECVVQNYMDVRPGPGIRDYTCGTLSYERHRGTDFRVLNYSSYQSGVPVLAAADGQILSASDGAPEGTYIKQGAMSTKGIESGNEVIVQHDNGWQTLYAHLRKGSIRVAIGEYVKAGDVLAMVGLSGKSEFTHLHFQVMRNNRIYDPYLGTTASGCQKTSAQGFWAGSELDKLKYQATGLVESGFSSEIPNYKNLPFSSERKRISLKDTANTLYYWIGAWGIKIADRITVSFTDPDGKSSSDQVIKMKNQASYFKYLGKIKPKNGWITGKYTGEIRLERIVAGAWITVFSSKSEINFP